MHIKEYIEKIVKDGDKKEMEALSYMLEEVVYMFKEYDEDLYCQYKMKLYEMAYGKVLTLDMAKEWVSEMIPMAKWTYEETSSVLEKYNLKIHPVSFYAIMNMMYSDMKSVLGNADTEESLQKYIAATKAWYYDEDAENGDEKLYCYWKYIVK